MPGAGAVAVPESVAEGGPAGVAVTGTGVGATDAGAGDWAAGGDGGLSRVAAGGLDAGSPPVPQPTPAAARTSAAPTSRSVADRDAGLTCDMDGTSRKLTWWALVRTAGTGTCTPPRP